MVKVLVVEDDARTSRLVTSGLSEAGHVVATAQDGAIGLELLRTESFDIVILDAIMPCCDGWSLLGDLRRRDPKTPVIMLSALDGIEHRLRGLSMGADDYLVKPFSFEELSLRLEAICRRSTSREVGDTAPDDLALDAVHLRAARGDVVIPLSAKEFALLQLLVEHRGFVLSKQFIGRGVWDVEFDSDSNVVEVNIRRLRQKVDEPFPRKLIHTMRGRGYVLR